MRNRLDKWLQLLRLGTFLTLIAAAYNTLKTCSPLGISGQFQPILKQTTGMFFPEGINGGSSLTELQLYIQYGFAAFFTIAALTSMRCGKRKKPKYILPVFISGVMLFIAAAKYGFDSDLKMISITPYLLPIATPFLLLSYRRLANKLDHWNYYANFFCVTTIFGNAISYLFYPSKSPRFQESIFSPLGLPPSYGELALTIFSYVAIFFALLTAFSITRRPGLVVLIIIGGLACVYRVLTLSLNSELAMSVDLIIADFLFYTSYWLIPLLIILSLASRRKTQTLKL
jgi:hypothetical protein